MQTIVPCGSWIERSLQIDEYVVCLDYVPILIQCRFSLYFNGPRRHLHPPRRIPQRLRLHLRLRLLRFLLRCPRSANHRPILLNQTLSQAPAPLPSFPKQPRIALEEREPPPLGHCVEELSRWPRGKSVQKVPIEAGGTSGWANMDRLQ